MLAAPLILGVASLFGSALAADEVSVKFSGSERILMPPTTDLEKEWDKAGKLDGARQRANDPVTTFIPSGGVTILKNPNLRKWLSERQNWMTTKSDSSAGLSQEEKALGVRDYSGKSNSSGNNSFDGFNIGSETDNAAGTDKLQKKNQQKTSSWNNSPGRNSSVNSKNEFGDSSDSASAQGQAAEKGLSSWTPQSITASPLADLYKNNDNRLGMGARPSSANPMQTLPSAETGVMPWFSSSGSFSKMDKARQIELRRKEEFQNLLQARPASPDSLAGVNDPVNLWPDSSRTEFNPVTGSTMDDVAGRNKPDIFGFAPSGGAGLPASRPGFLDSLSGKSLGSGSLTPALPQVAAPDFRPNPGVLDMPSRRKF